MVFRGLRESFPQFSNDYLLYYLYSKPGINRKLTLDELTTVRLKGSLADEDTVKDLTVRQETQNKESEGSNENDYFDFDHSLMKNKQRQSN